MEKADVVGYLNPKHLRLTLMPTENCNFRCTYCYEDFEIGRMSEETITAVKNMLLLRLPKLDSLHIAWFGGEPLLAKDIVLELNQFAKTEAEKLGVHFSSAMTTNAFSLLPELFDQLVKQDIRHYQISLDGDEEQHNLTRKLISGRGSFAKIWANLLEMRNSSEKFTIALRVHVHRENIASVKDLLRRINTEFGADTRFVISLKAVWNGGGEGVKSLDLILRPADVIAELTAQLEADGWFTSRTPAATKPKFDPCYAAKPSAFVVRANGTLAKCTVAFSDPRNAVGVLNPDGSMELNRELMKVFMRGFADLNEKALHCPMNGMPKLEHLQEAKIIKIHKKEELITA